MNPHAGCAFCVPTHEQSQCCGDEREDFLTVLRVISWTRQWKPPCSICTGLKTMANHTSLQAEAKQHQGVCNQLVSKAERP